MGDRLITHGLHVKSGDVALGKWEDVCGMWSCDIWSR